MTNVAEPKDNHAPMGQFYRARKYPDASCKDVTAPNADTLVLMMRMYWPKKKDPSILDGSWEPPAVKRLEK
jgi:hypothetical protein